MCVSSILEAFCCAFGFSLCPTWVISSHLSVPELRNLVNKQALERAREPATSWKYEATRLSTEMLSFQEGVTESEQRPWLPISPHPGFPTLPLCPDLRIPGCVCVLGAGTGGGAGITHHTTPAPALLHKPILPLACASGLSLSTKLGWVKFPLHLREECHQEAQLFRECRI